MGSPDQHNAVQRYGQSKNQRCKRRIRFQFELVGENLPKITVKDVEEDDDTLTAVGECEAFPGKEIPVSVTFDDDTFVCVVKLPFVGKIKLSGNKIAD